MAVIKCKMCGGDLQIIEGSTVCECEYCGTKQTVPSADNEKKLTLFGRAGRLLRACEFDKAAGVFETIIADFPEEAEAYWGLVLCKYGIEYVDDPATGKKIPTCHRSSFDSVMDDSNYEQACENTDAVARRVYRDEARQIEELRQAILQVSGKEEPYDVFISYKETGENGDRTLDSVIAQDIYKELTDEGYRVFFSRISLEDKLGTEYEPYIFAALNSTKVMLVVGTDYENFDAVWVKNEWSRFLKLIAKGEKKTLIPVFKNMDAYDMPKEFAKLSAQDMGKVGAMQDLVRGVEKIVGKKKTEPAQEHVIVQQSGGSDIGLLLKRAFMYLEDGNFSAADEYCERVLDLDPENGRAYLGKLLAELHVRRQEDLSECDHVFDQNSNYKKIVRFRDETLASALNGYIDKIKERNETEKQIFEKKVSAVVAAIKANYGASRESVEKKLTESKAKIELLEKLLHEFDILLTKASQLQEEKADLVNKESLLSEQRSKLGVFNNKEKKRIDAELISLSEKKRDITSQISLNLQQRHSYAYKQDIVRDIEKEKAVASDLETWIKKDNANSSNAYSYEEAMAIYQREPDIAREVNSVFPAAAHITAIPGKRNSVMFGRYVQKESGISEPIEWQILSRENGRILLVSRYALDGQKYNASNVSVTWETCTLRKWLNGTFLNEAFSPEERALIPCVTVSADKNPSYDTFPGNSTTDQVFLLSIVEAEKYFSSNEARICWPTAFVKVHREVWPVKIHSEDACFWWLRSPGSSSTRASCVTNGGSILSKGDIVKAPFDDTYAVRPALWIEVGS